MFALAPRVLIDDSVVGEKLYVVPLVDERFFWQFKNVQFNRTSTTWKQIWDAVKPSIESHRVTLVDTDAQPIFASGSSETYYGPDKNMIVTGWNSVALVIDAMMAATAFRCIFTPVVQRISSPPSAYGTPPVDVKLGGGTTTPRAPTSITFSYWNGTEPINRRGTITKTNPSPSGFTSTPAWELAIDTTLNQPEDYYSQINAYFSALATRYFGWWKFQFDAVYSGIHVAAPMFANTTNGTIDAFLYSLGSLSDYQHSNNQLTTRIYSLPPWAVSRQLAVSGLKRDDTHFTFRLLEDLSPGIAWAELQYLDGSQPFSAELIDATRNQMFHVLDAGATGIAVAQHDQFYVIQAECDSESSNPPESSAPPVIDTEEEEDAP
jgi:hypothetical protein